MIYQDDNVLVAYPLVSIFIFTYNQEKIVSKTIESVLAQDTSYPYEIVIAEDCSKDSTLQVCLNYQKKYPDKIRVIGNEKNKGMIVNFHDAICHYARGKYIAEVAGDDWWHDPFKIQKQVDFLESHTDYGLVFSDTLIYSEQEKKLLDYTPCERPCNFRELIIHNSIPALTTCYRKDLFIKYVDEIDPVAQDFPGEDYPMWIWFSYYTKLFHIKEPLTTYRLQNETLSHSTSKQRRLQFEVDRLNIKMFFYNFFKLKDEGVLHDIYLRFYFLTLNTASEADNREIEKQRIVFFRNNKYYLFLLLAILNQWFASCKPLSSMMRFILKACMKFRLVDHYSRVYNKQEV